MRMKKSIIVLTTLLIIGISCFTIITSNASEMRKTKMICNTSAKLCTEVVEGYNNGQKGPMMIVKGTLTKDKVKATVYLITLSGTENVDGQSTNVVSDIKSAFELENDYKVNVRDKMIKYIPKNSSIVIAGHSLGGMVAQQLSSDDIIKDNFNIIRTIAFGAPLVSPYNKEGSVKRFVDSKDAVPNLSLSNYVFKKARIFNYQINYSNSNYSIVDAHQCSYIDEKVWAGYDFLGNKYSNASFTFYLEDKQYFKCPVLNQ